MNIEELLKYTIQHNASDLHLVVGYPPMVRIDGVLLNASNYIIDDTTIKTFIDPLLSASQKEFLDVNKEVDFSYEFKETHDRFRINVFHQLGHLSGALRLIPSKIRTLEELFLPETIHNFTNLPQGLILVTGPTGSGKSTTLAAMIHKINNEKAVHIVTIEDPIEYTHRSIKSVVVQREVHYDTYSFSAALR